MLALRSPMAVHFSTGVSPAGRASGALERENVENEAYSADLRSEKERRAVERLLAVPAGAIMQTPQKSVSVAHLHHALWDRVDALEAAGSSHTADGEPVRRFVVS
jgi:hypothetical protein